MKVLLVLFLTVLLSGCFFEASPRVLDLQDQTGQLVGKAFAVDDRTFVTADHVFATHHPLFYNNRLLTVLARQGKEDYMEFSLPQDFIQDFKIARFRKELPEIESLVYWPGGSGTIESLDQSVNINSRDYAGLIVVRGIVTAGDSGGPVYDAANEVIGLIVGGTSTQIFVRPYNR